MRKPHIRTSSFLNMAVGIYLCRARPFRSLLAGCRSSNWLRQLSNPGRVLIPVGGGLCGKARTFVRALLDRR